MHAILVWPASPRQAVARLDPGADKLSINSDKLAILKHYAYLMATRAEMQVSQELNLVYAFFLQGFSSH